MSVFALSSDNQGDSLTFGVVVLICLLGKGEIISVNIEVPQGSTCTLRFGAGLISWGLVFLVCHSLRHFLSIFWNCTADYFMS